MTKKDYVAIAKVLNDVAWSSTPEELVAVKQVAEKLADLFGRQRSQFDRERFLLASVKLAEPIPAE